MRSVAQTAAAPQPAMGSLPFARTRRTLFYNLAQYLRLVRVMGLEYRETWYIHAIFGFLFPLGMIFFMKAAMGTIDPARATFLVGGNMTMSVAYGPTQIMISRLGWGKQYRTFDYWTALPLPKLGVILALVTVSLFLSLPGVLGVWLLGSLMLGLPLAGGLFVLPLLPLGALSLCGFGAFIGAYAKDGQTANALSNAMIGFVTFLSPLMIPSTQMPKVLQWTALAMPTTYVAETMRAALRGDITSTFFIHVGILVAFSVSFLWLVHKKLDWRAM